MPTSCPPGEKTRSPTCNAEGSTGAPAVHWFSGVEGTAKPASSQAADVRPPQSYVSGPDVPPTNGLPSCDSAVLTAATVSADSTVTGPLPVTAHGTPGTARPAAPSA